MARIDRRAIHVLVDRNAALDEWDDVETLAQEGHRRVTPAHEAHVQNDWPRYLHAMTYINDRLIRIEDLAAAAKRRLAEAQQVDPNQLQVWAREDGAVVAPTGTAA